MPGFPSDDEQFLEPLLVIDTSSAQGSVALYDGRRLSTRSWPAGRSHTTTLLTEIQHLLDAAALDVSAIAAIGVAVGPGAFTGLRVGVGAAKGFHLAIGAPLIGISTLEATAFPFIICGRSVVATVAAGRGRLVWSRYSATTEGAAETQPPRNGTAEELVEELQALPPAIVAGELDDNQERLVAACDRASLLPPTIRGRRPEALAELAWRRWLDGSVDDPILLEPVYLSR
jgi:tRNA threonylcarbamoyladenosine biosynthesis protein TsaB